MVRVMYNFLSTSLTLNLIEFGTENNIFLRKRALSWRFVELEMVLILIYTFSITLPTSGKVTAVFCAFKMNKNTDMSWIWMFPQNPYTKITWLLNWADECYLLVAMLSLTQSWEVYHPNSNIKVLSSRGDAISSILLATR